MELLAIALLGFFVLGYLVLGGADIGVGMTLPFLGRDSDDRRVVIAAIAPFFLGNEVWLVATAGILAGGFPVLEGTLLSGLFGAFVALLVGWVVRDMGLWLRGRVDARMWRALCDAAITVGSATVALCWGWVFTRLLLGTSGPATVVGAVAIAALFAAHGLAFAGLRLSGTLRDRVGRLGWPRSFAATSAAMALLCLAVGLRLPLSTSAADPATLSLIMPVLLVVTPLLVAAQAMVWRIFRHRVKGPSYL